MEKRKFSDFDDNSPLDAESLIALYDLLYREIFNNYTPQEQIDLSHLRDNNFDPAKTANQSKGQVYKHFWQLKGKFQDDVSKIRKLLKIFQKRNKNEDVSPYE